MQVRVGGANSEIEAAAKKRLINEKEIKLVITDHLDPKALRIVKTRIRELLDFYDRIISSIEHTIKTISRETSLTQLQKKKLVLDKQEKELSQAKSEKNKFRKYLKTVELKLAESCK